MHNMHALFQHIALATDDDTEESDEEQPGTASIPYDELDPLLEAYATPPLKSYMDKARKTGTKGEVKRKSSGAKTTKQSQSYTQRAERSAQHVRLGRQESHTRRQKQRNMARAWKELDSTLEVLGLADRSPEQQDGISSGPISTAASAASLPGVPQQTSVLHSLGAASKLVATVGGTVSQSVLVPSMSEQPAVRQLEQQEALTHSMAVRSESLPPLSSGRLVRPVLKCRLMRTLDSKAKLEEVVRGREQFHDHLSHVLGVGSSITEDELQGMFEAAAEAASNLIEQVQETQVVPDTTYQAQHTVRTLDAHLKTVRDILKPLRAHQQMLQQRQEFKDDYHQLVSDLLSPLAELARFLLQGIAKLLQEASVDVSSNSGDERWSDLVKVTRMVLDVLERLCHRIREELPEEADTLEAPLCDYAVELLQAQLGAVDKLAPALLLSDNLQPDTSAHETTSKVRALTNVWEECTRLMQRLGKLWPLRKLDMHMRVCQGYLNAAKLAVSMQEVMVEDDESDDEDEASGAWGSSTSASRRAAPASDEDIQSHAWVPSLCTTLLQQAKHAHRKLREELVDLEEGEIPYEEEINCTTLLDQLQATFADLVLVHTRRTAALCRQPGPLGYWALESLFEQAKTALKLVQIYDKSTLGLGDILKVPRQELQPEDPRVQRAVDLFEYLRRATLRLINRLLHVRTLLDLRKSSESAPTSDQSAEPQKPPVLSLAAPVAEARKQAVQATSQPKQAQQHTSARTSTPIAQHNPIRLQRRSGSGNQSVHNHSAQPKLRRAGLQHKHLNQSAEPRQAQQHQQQNHRHIQVYVAQFSKEQQLRPPTDALPGSPHSRRTSDAGSHTSTTPDATPAVTSAASTITNGTAGAAYDSGRAPPSATSALSSQLRNLASTSSHPGQRGGHDMQIQTRAFPSPSSHTILPNRTPAEASEDPEHEDDWQTQHKPRRRNHLHHKRGASSTRGGTHAHGSRGQGRVYGPSRSNSRHIPLDNSQEQQYVWPPSMQPAHSSQTNTNMATLPSASSPFARQTSGSTGPAGGATQATAKSPFDSAVISPFHTAAAAIPQVSSQSASGPASMLASATKPPQASTWAAIAAARPNATPNIVNNPAKQPTASTMQSPFAAPAASDTLGSLSHYTVTAQALELKPAIATAVATQAQPVPSPPRNGSAISQHNTHHGPIAFGSFLVGGSPVEFGRYMPTVAGSPTTPRLNSPQPEQPASPSPVKHQSVNGAVAAPANSAVAVPANSGPTHVPSQPSPSDRPAAAGNSYGLNMASSSDDAFWSIKWSDLQKCMTHFAGEGSYGQVWYGHYKHHDVAIKVFSLDRDEPLSQEKLAAFRHEVDLQRKLSQHPNVVRFMGACCDFSVGCGPLGDGGHPMLAIVMEQCKLGDLFKMVSKARASNKEQEGASTPVKPTSPGYMFANNWERRLEVLVGAAAGLEFMHSHQVVHRDLTSYNLLVDRDKEPQRWMGKVCDFSLARQLISSAKPGSSMLHSPGWQSPEVLQGHSYTPSTDVYSFGVVIWEVVTLQKPWLSDQEGDNDMRHVVPRVLSSVPNGKRLEFPPAEDIKPSLPEVGELIALAKECWAQNPRERPTMATVVETLSRVLKNVRQRNLLKRREASPAATTH